MVRIYQWWSLQTTHVPPMLSFFRLLATSASPIRSLKRDSAGGKLSIVWHDTLGWLEIMIHHTPSIICGFHFPVDFRLNILSPHIFWFLHQNWVGIGWFTLTKLRSVGDEDKTIPSCLDTSNPMVAPPVLPQSAFCALKTTDWPKLDRFKFLVLDILNAWRVSAELQLESQSELMGSSRI